jgi:signal transduction histidine kinase
VVAGMASLLSNQYVLRPLTDIAQIAQQITTTDDFSQRIPVRGQTDDIVDELTINFNKTLDRLEGLIDMERRFMAYVSHELRTPLTVIKGNVGLMRITKTVDQESLNSIETEVDRLTRLVTDLLLIEQTEMGDSKLLREPIEIDDLLMEVFTELKVLSGGAHDIQIMNIEPAVVRGVRDRLKQVLLNLGSNAVNYSPEGGKVLLDLEVESPWVKLRIIDEGVGIPQDELDNLFERFYRGRNVLSLRKKNVGFGLGLAIANNIVRNHGGHIDLDSVEGKGTTILVWLPISMTDIPTRPIDQIMEG